MRNIIEYPITCDEAIGQLQDAQDDYRIRNDGMVGGIGGLTLFYVEQFIKANKTEFENFTKTLPGRIDG